MDLKNQEMELKRQEMVFKKLEEEQCLEIDFPCEETLKKLSETKLHELEQINDVSQASQDLLEEVSPINLDDVTENIRIEQWVNGSTAQCDQPPLSIAVEAEAETHAGVTARDNQPQLPSTSIE